MCTRVLCVFLLSAVCVRAIPTTRRHEKKKEEKSSFFHPSVGIFGRVRLPMYLPIILCIIRFVQCRLGSVQCVFAFRSCRRYMDQVSGKCVRLKVRTRAAACISSSYDTKYCAMVRLRELDPQQRRRRSMQCVADTPEPA